MTQLVELLLDNSEEDLKVLELNEREGDNPSIPREVDFIFYAPDQELAELVKSFINDNSYGKAQYINDDDRHLIKVIVFMPLTKNLICSVSGLMACVAKIFNIEYDGWSSDLQRNT